jgi:hypothetical protein
MFSALPARFCVEHGRGWHAEYRFSGARLGPERGVRDMFAGSSV